MLVVMLSCIEDGMTIELLDELDVKFYGGEFDKGFDQDMLTTAAVLYDTQINIERFTKSYNVQYHNYMHYIFI
ncbi:unnamed protein product [Rhizophagus irregularis]|nr:unnamed protein product [Rhizophagus irregularis]CAB4492999.1 unnamed protein product [Rhizophagus irregularis]